MHILQLQHISIWSALISVVSTDSAVAVISDSAVLGDLSGERQLAGIGLGKSDHTLHSPVNFEVAAMLSWKTFPSFRTTLKSVYPWEICLMYYGFFCVFFFFSILGSFRNMIFLSSLFPK